VLAANAQAATDPTEALAAWREALTLLPPDSRQHAEVRARVLDLSRRVTSPAPVAAPTPPTYAKGGRWTGIGAAALALLWKGKTLLLLVFGKLKFLLLGLSKLSTLLSMFASFGVYAMLWGWRYAAGFVLSIYVHEIGHVVALRRFGIPASAPMFIPGFGALVRMRQYPATAREDARVGIAGPVWGTGASIVGMGLAWAFHSQLLTAIAATSASINLFNLLAIGSLDGGRAYRGLSNTERALVALVCGVSWYASGSPMTMLVGLVLGGRALAFRDGNPEGDPETAGWFAGIVVILSGIASRMPSLTGS
jgi:Zn-dependent protease